MTVIGSVCTCGRLMFHAGPKCGRCTARAIIPSTRRGWTEILVLALIAAGGLGVLWWAP